MGLSGLEPPTSRLSGVRSNRLSYKPNQNNLIFKSGSHLLSHTVSSIVSSAVWVLTIVFGMYTGVSPKRIATRIVFTSWIHWKLLRNFCCIQGYWHNRYQVSLITWPVIKVVILKTFLVCIYLKWCHITKCYAVFKVLTHFANGHSHLFVLRCSKYLFWATPCFLKSKINFQN